MTLAAGASIRDYFPIETIGLTSGAIFVEVVSGSIEGCVYWG